MAIGDEVCQSFMRSQLLVFLAKAAGLWSGQVLSQSKPPSPVHTQCHRTERQAPWQRKESAPYFGVSVSSQRLSQVDTVVSGALRAELPHPHTGCPGQ